MEFNVVACQSVAVGRGRGRDQFFEPGAVDCDELAAYIALQVVMVWLEWPCKLVALLPADVDDFDDTELVEEYKRAVDAATVHCGQSVRKLCDRKRLVC